uniref:VWFA domain-containing protein n=1 Tax=Anas platyrhynchos platyrhynchos TaxID=8840 RepID=A0A493TAG0_ANAPP
MELPWSLCWKPCLRILLEAGSTKALHRLATIADIAFLVDESSKVGSKNFQLIRAFLLKVVDALDIGPRNVRVGLVLYSDEPRLEFTLNTFKDKLEILNYLKNLPYRGGRTYTGAAIEFLRNKVFTREAGSRKRKGVQQIAVVITDGQSLDDYTKPASKLRRKGVTVYAVGIQNTTESSKLDKIATYPPKNHVTTLKNFLQLSNIRWKINKRLCNDIVKSCVNTEEADIYFLIDGSGSIQRNDFEDIKTFVNETTRMFQVGANNVRIGVVQYASAPKKEFGGGTRTGDALIYMKSLFQMASRENVPQILVVITDGKSEDEVKQAAGELRQQGITIYAIGIKEAVQQQLEEIAETRVYFVNDFDSLKNIKEGIVQNICSTNGKTELKEITEDQERLYFAQNYDALESIHKNLAQIVCEKSKPGKDTFG